MTDLSFFSLCSVSMDGGESTVLGTWENPYDYITSIAVMHEECGKSGIESKGIPFSDWITSVTVCRGCHLTFIYITFVLTIMLSFHYANL